MFTLTLGMGMLSGLLTFYALFQYAATCVGTIMLIKWICQLFVKAIDWCTSLLDR